VPQYSVLIDGTAMPVDLGGVGRYIEGLLGALDPLDLDLAIVVRPEHRQHVTSVAPGADVVVGPRWLRMKPLRFAWEQLGLPALARRLGSDVVHSPHYTFPLLRRRGSVVTLHDATFFSDPQWHSVAKRLFFTTWTRLALRSGRPCVVPSDASAGEFRRHVPRVRSTLTTTALGVDFEVFHTPGPDETAAFRAAHGLAGAERWVAFLGTIEPRKNVGPLVRAHERLRRERDDVPTLLVSGARGWDDDAAAELDRVAPGGAVRELGVYPSSGEGFGLPVLEALACGACVLTTDRLSLPEVAGDAAEYTEPDEEALLDALRRLVSDRARRDELRERAAPRARLFTWDATAEATLEAYREAAA
jgi:glycosyltransferase involved in cell wall biosynthesis